MERNCRQGLWRMSNKPISHEALLEKDGGAIDPEFPSQYGKRAARVMGGHGDGTHQRRGFRRRRERDGGQCQPLSRQGTGGSRLN